MTNSFSPKKAPNVFNQETLERALTVLRQPFSIAVIASLGLHGVLWAALPNILAETAKEADTKQRVRTVELSPAEQSQLPTFGINQIAPTLTPTKPVPPATSGDKLPDPYKLPDPNKLYSYPLDTIPVFPPPNIYPNDFSSLFPKTPEPKKEPPKQTTTPGKTKVPPPPPSPEPKATEPAQPTNSGGKDGNVEAPAQSKPLSSERLAQLQKDAERSRQLRSLYAFNGPTTPDKAFEDGKANLTSFQASVAKATNGSAYDDTRFIKNPEKVADLFPKEACPYIGGARNASFGAIVKPDGSLAETPTVLLTSGFKGLDNAAIEDISSVIKNKKLGESGKFQLIRFDYVFDPKTSCPNPSKPA